MEWYGDLSIPMPKHHHPVPRTPTWWWLVWMWCSCCWDGWCCWCLVAKKKVNVKTTTKNNKKKLMSKQQTNNWLVRFFCCCVFCVLFCAFLFGIPLLADLRNSWFYPFIWFKLNRLKGWIFDLLVNADLITWQVKNTL